MGMFSWCCKGCGQELHEGELVRLNGSKGIYDGYGNAGGYSYEDSEVEPYAWHEACYQKATDKQKLDETPSKNAPNQGFGRARIEFAPPKYKFKGYVVVATRVEACKVPTDKGLKDNVLVVEYTYNQSGKIGVVVWDSTSPNAPWSEVNLTEEEFQGLLSHVFPSLDEALAKAKEMLPDFENVAVLTEGDGDNGRYFMAAEFENEAQKKKGQRRLKEYWTSLER